MSSFDHAFLETLLRRRCPDLPDPLTFSPVPTGKFNTSYFVRAGDRDLVLRLAPPRDSVFLFYERDMMRQEPELHELLRRETEAPVARIVAFDDAHELLDRDFLLMERLPGRPLTEAFGVAADRALRQLGAHLARVHRLTADRYGYLGAHRPMPPQPTWVEAFHVMWNKLLDDIVAVGGYAPEEADALRRLLDARLPFFDRPVPASLLHMDIWGQNLLVDGRGDLTGIVDWDRALWGDPEIEFAVLDYCGVSEPAFWEGYGAPRDASPEARVRRLFYLLYELQKYIVIRRGRQRDPAGADRYKRRTFELVNAHLSGGRR